MHKTVITQRHVPPQAMKKLLDEGASPLLARLLAARGATSIKDVSIQLSDLLSPEELMGSSAAAELLGKVILAQDRIVIAADYDCDGATACAVAIKGLVMLGVDRQLIDFVVPDRVTMGYGLSEALVELAAQSRPKLLITVDNGIASVEGVSKAQSLGIQVLVTDHHLPGERATSAEATVNPNQRGCTFPSKALSGVGVMFYVLIATRAWLRHQGHKIEGNAPLQDLLDLVALGTVADLVPMDRNNRILVAQGLKRMRNGKIQTGLKAIAQSAGVQTRDLRTRDLGFSLAPRINAAGRLSDMGIGIRCLTTEDPEEANELATQLEAINQERKSIQQDMLEMASLPDIQPDTHSLVVFDDQWHHGIVGLVASRLKDRWSCPVFALAPVSPDSTEVRGSGRSIQGVHLRDVLDVIAKQNPGLIPKFGGHAMAAGVTIDKSQLETFSKAFNRAVASNLGKPLPGHTLETDGELDGDEINLNTQAALAQIVWGQRFEPPIFEADVQIQRQTVLKGKHLKVVVKTKKLQLLEAIRFFDPRPLPTQCRLVFELQSNTYQGIESVNLHIIGAY